MKQRNGFIATSLLYSFFLAFVTLFIGMVSVYLQNRVYLNKFEDSSKNAIYIREIKQELDNSSSISIMIDGSLKNYNEYTENVFKTSSGGECNLSKCEQIYSNESDYYAKGCPSSC